METIQKTKKKIINITKVENKREINEKTKKAFYWFSRHLHVVKSVFY